MSYPFDKSPAAESLEQILELAMRAPSVHNTQPWRWRVTDRGVELRVDRRFQLPATDPRGRNLILSCGAALHHVQIAALGLGWRPTVRRGSDASDADLLARIELTPHATGPTDAAALSALRERRTDRRRFTSWPVPADVLQLLCGEAHSWGSVAVPIVEMADRASVHLLVHHAWTLQERDTDTFTEQRAWIDHGPDDGIPAKTFTAGGGPSSRARFGAAGMRDLDDADVGDATIVLGGSHENPGSWLRTGEALSALWLRATAAGLSVVPLSQVTEVESTRSELKSRVFDGDEEPHLLVRVGWQPIGRGDLIRTPRRPLRDCLDL